MIEIIPIWLTDNAVLAGVLIVAVIATVYLLKTSKGNPDLPKPTGEYYTPKHDGDVPGWEK